MIMSPVKTAEPIEMLFRLLTRVGPRNHVLDRVQITTREGAILGVRRGWFRTCPVMSRSQYTQSSSVGGSTAMVQMPTGMYWMRVHIRATCRIWLNHSVCGVSALYARLLWPLAACFLLLNTISVCKRLIFFISVWQWWRW